MCCEHHCECLFLAVVWVGEGIVGKKKKSCLFKGSSKVHLEKGIQLFFLYWQPPSVKQARDLNYLTSLIRKQQIWAVASSALFLQTTNKTLKNVPSPASCACAVGFVETCSQSSPPGINIAFFASHFSSVHEFCRLIRFHRCSCSLRGDC